MPTLTPYLKPSPRASGNGRTPTSRNGHGYAAHAHHCRNAPVNMIDFQGHDASAHYSTTE